LEDPELIESQIKRQKQTETTFSSQATESN
jgi:hypothetical protein